MLTAENMCMLDGKTLFIIQNIPETAILLRFNVLFAYLYDAVSGGKGMMQLQVDPAKNQTITSIMHETFRFFSRKPSMHEHLHTRQEW